MNTTQIVHQTNLKKWADIIRDQQSSSLTVKDWCSQHQVSKDQFYYWKRKLKDKFVESQLPDIIPISSQISEPYCTSFTTDARAFRNNGVNLATNTMATHNSTIGKALAYSINQEEYLHKFLTDGRIPMDNNYAEQAIRPFTIARKNFVLMESDNGAKAKAMIFSIAETAKANAINTYEYFNLLLSEIPKHQDDKDTKYLDALLPWSKMSKMTSYSTPSYI